MEQNGKVFVLTGATSGIGFAAARRLLQAGASVIGVGRFADRCKQARAALLQELPQADIQFCVADLSLLSQVTALAEEIKQLLADRGQEHLDGLINNAGTFTYWLTLTAEGLETQWATNHLAPFLLTHKLLPMLAKAPLARVVTVSSGSHYHTRLRWEDLQLRRRYNGLLAYKQTKLANVLFTAELNRRLGQNFSLRAFAADPGLVKTDIGLKSGSVLARWVWKLRRAGGVIPEISAKGIVFLALEPSIQNSPHIYWKDSQPKAPDPYALEPVNGWRLWEISAQMCGLAESDTLPSVGELLSPSISRPTERSRP